MAQIRKRIDPQACPLRRSAPALLLMLSSLGVFISPHVVVALPFHVLEGTDVGPLSLRGGAILTLAVVASLLLLVRAGRWMRTGVLHADLVVFALGVLDSAAVCLLLRTQAAWPIWAVATLASLALVISVAGALAFVKGKLESGES